jgi:hypothetical protein
MEGPQGKEGVKVHMTSTMEAQNILCQLYTKQGDNNASKK